VTQLPNKKSGFELVRKTSKAAIMAWGKDLPNLFAATATGMFTVITNPEEVQPSQLRKLELSAGSKQELLQEWLELLNDLHQIKNEFYVKFDVTIKGNTLEAAVRGERIDPKRHAPGTEVKGVTLRELNLEKTERGFETHVDLKL